VLPNRAISLDVLTLDYPDALERPGQGPSVVAIGMFDGLHRGHRGVIRAARDRARALGVPCTVFTFVGHPRAILRPEDPPSLLTPWDEKVRVLACEEVDRLVGAHFTHDFSRIEPEAFIDQILCSHLAAREVVVGYNFAFGRAQGGSVETLREAGQVRGFGVTVVSPVEHEGAPVSSTRIRQLLVEGRVEAVASLLDRPYMLSGTVVQGDQRGRLLGFPTANLDVASTKQLPAFGVYAGRARWRDRDWPTVINLGVRPTFGVPTLRVEAHLLGFEGDLYGEHMTLELEHRLRPEQAFPGVDALVAQIRLDADEAGHRLGVSLPGETA